MATQETILGSLICENSITCYNVGSVSNPAANYTKLYFDGSGNLKQVNSSGTVSDVGGGGDRASLGLDTTDTVEFAKLGLGTSDVPHGSVGYAKLAIDGGHADSTAPIVQFTTTVDNYPIMNIFPWVHDNAALMFDSYYDGSFRSSDAGSNFSIYKASDQLKFRYDSSIAAGSVLSWNDGIVLDTSGRVGVGTSSLSDTLTVETASGDCAIRVNAPTGSQAELSMYSGTEQWQIFMRDSDTNFGIYNPSVGTQLRIAESPTAYMTLMENGGDIAIGTNTPAYNLHVHEPSTSSAYISVTNTSTGATSSDGVQLGIDSAHAFLINRENTPLDFYTFGNLRMSIDAGGDVGIGTSTIPKGGVGYAKLAIEGTDGSSAAPSVLFTTSADNYPLMNILPWRHDDVQIMFDSYYDGLYRSSDVGSNFSIVKAADRLYFRYDSGVSQGSAITWNSGMILNTSGNLGIGGAPASNRLEVQGGTIGMDNGTGLTAKTTGGTYTNIFNANGDDTISFGASSGWSSLRFFPGASEAMRITSGGVGIGSTTIPHGSIGIAKVAIEGTNASSAGPHMQFTTASDDYPLLHFSPWTHDNINIAYDAYRTSSDWRSSDAGSNFAMVKTGDQWKLLYDSGITAGSALTWNEGIIMDTSGQVGINETSPESILHCKSSVYPVLTSERTSSNTTSVLGASRFKHTTSGNMADGFGVNAVFTIEDGAASEDIAEIAAYRTGADDSGSLAFYTYSTGTRSEQMTISPAGHVGINTSPLSYSKLSIEGEAASGSQLDLLTPVDSHPIISHLCWSHDNLNQSWDAYANPSWTSSDAGSNFQLRKSGDAFRIRYDSGVAAGAAVTWNEGFIMDTSGQVGIGGVTPSYTLDVGGSGRFTGDLVIATKTPSSASDTGTTGEIAWDGTYIYICVSTDTWQRVATATW